MTPTEHEGTVAVDAAARVLARHTQRRGAEWDDLKPLTQNALREQVLPLVRAALEALPDRSAAVRAQAKIEWENGNLTDSALSRIEGA